MRTPLLSRNSVQQEVERFNRECLVGHAGFLHKDDGRVLPTFVERPAQEMGGRCVAWFEGVRGCYVTNRFVPLR
jgi:hypothetical protein